MHSCVAPLGPAGGQLDTVTRAVHSGDRAESLLVEIWENERYIPLKGWGAPSLPTDREHFTDLLGRPQ